MADNIVDSLFGPQLWQIQQQQNQGLQQFAAQQANRDPLQMAKYGLTMGGGLLGGAAMESMGYQNPAIAAAQQRQVVMGMGGDLSTAAGLKEKAAQFSAAGDQQTAMKLIMLARKQEQEDAKQFIDQRKADLADKRQWFLETDAQQLKRDKLAQDYELAKERAADRRLSDQDRLSAARDANNIRLMIAQMMAGVKEGRKQDLSATAQKEVIAADEAVMGSEAGAKALQQALDLNKKAMGFKGAGIIADVGSILPDVIRPKAFDATQELDNIVQGSVLPQLKSIFGANPTEGERKILLDVAGSSSKPAPVREGIFARAKLAAENRRKFNAEKAASLRAGTYFKGQGLAEPTIDEAVSEQTTPAASSSGWSIKRK